jgi:cytochrome c5
MQVLVAFLFFAFVLAAQQPAPAPVVKQDVAQKMVEAVGPVQPIPYSHKKHLAMGLTCDLCHTNPEPGILMKFPETATCMGCHATVARDKPAIRKLAEYAKTKTPIPWVRVYVVLPGVSWNHRAHLQAGIKCEICHGQVDQLEVMARVTGVTAMFGCIDCHESHNARTACEICHKN